MIEEIEPDAYGRTGERGDCLTCAGTGRDYGETCIGCGGLGWFRADAPPSDAPDVSKRRLLGDLRAVLAHHNFTATRVGQPGCEVRKVAAEYAETIRAAIAFIEPTSSGTGGHG